MDVFEKIYVRDNKKQLIKRYIERVQSEMKSETFNPDLRRFNIKTIATLKKALISMEEDVGLYRNNTYVRYVLRDEECECVQIAIYNMCCYLDLDLDSLNKDYEELQKQYCNLKKTYDDLKDSKADGDLTEDDFNWDDEDFNWDDEISEDDNKVNEK